MKETRKRNRVRFQYNNRIIKAGIAASLVSAGCLCFSLVARAGGSPPPHDGPASNVWLDVVQAESEARVSVTVPLGMGFVVVGSNDAGATTGVSVEDGTLLLPNVRVVVEEESDPLPNAPGNKAKYGVQTVADQILPVRNYSTDVREEDLEEDPLPREGLPVKLVPYLVTGEDFKVGNTTVTHHWKASATVPQAVAGDFKKYHLSLDSKPFSVPDQLVVDSGAGTTIDIIKLNGSIDLAAPPDVPLHGYKTSGLAIVPSEHYLAFDVKVGGVRNQYKQVEHSGVVAEIRWEIIPGQLP